MHVSVVYEVTHNYNQSGCNYKDNSLMEGNKMKKRVKSKKTLIGKNVGTAIRKIIKIGKSHGICIPHEFLHKNGIEIGDEVIVCFNHVLKVISLQERL